MREFVCPSCEIALQRMQQKSGIFWKCTSCGGRSSTVSLMRKHVPREIVNELWQGIRNVDYPEIRQCSCCPGMMEQIPIDLPGGQVLLDVCSRCQFVWFDADEYEQLPLKSLPVDTKTELPYAARETMATWQVKQLADRAKAESGGGDDAPDEFWKYIPAFLGMPVEVGADAEAPNAWITWGLALVIASVSVLTFNGLSELVDQYGMIPAQAWRMGGLTLITSFFLHAGPIHMLSNLYFFLSFGDNVEAVLGKWKFILLLLLATVVGDIAHIMSDPASTIPCIGASGGISGVLAFYALAFPHARLALLLRYYFRFAWMRMPAIGFFAIWIALQVFGVYNQLNGIGSVSYMAHIGGVAVGVVFWALWRLFGYRETNVFRSKLAAD